MHRIYPPQEGAGARAPPGRAGAAALSRAALGSGPRRGGGRAALGSRPRQARGAAAHLQRA
jgi:hypothetical protein